MPLEVTHEDFLSPEQVRALKEHCRRRAEGGEGDRRERPVRDWAIIHVALDAGLRVSEICALQIRDVILDQGHSSLIVRHGKEHCRSAPLCADCPIASICPHPKAGR